VEDDFRVGSKISKSKTYLKKGAVPTIFAFEANPSTRKTRTSIMKRSSKKRSSPSKKRKVYPAKKAKSAKDNFEMEEIQDEQVPVIVSSRSLKISESDKNMNGSKDGSLTFTYGRKPSEVLKIFNTITTYLTNNPGTLISTDWYHSITLESASENSGQVLTIYQLKSTREGVTLPRTIQMFTDQTIRISLESKDCTYVLMKDLVIESPEGLARLIERLTEASICTGCVGFETILRCPRGTREGNIWYSTQCNRLIPVPKTDVNLVPNATCKPCRAIRLSLRNQKAKITSEFLAKEKEQTQQTMSSGLKNLKDFNNPAVKNMVQDRLRAVWNTLGYDQVPAGKWLPPPTNKPPVIPMNLGRPTTTSVRVSDIVTIE